MIWQIILQIALIALNAVFACAEIAVISANPTKIDKLADDGNKKAVRLKKLTEEPARFLATIQVAITLSGFIGFYYKFIIRFALGIDKIRRKIYNYNSDYIKPLNIIF